MPQYSPTPQLVFCRSFHGLLDDLFLQNDVDLIHEIEAELGKQLEEFECKEKDVLAEITKVEPFYCKPY